MEQADQALGLSDKRTWLLRRKFNFGAAYAFLILYIFLPPYNGLMSNVLGVLGSFFMGYYLSYPIE